MVGLLITSCNYHHILVSYIHLILKFVSREDTVRSFDEVLQGKHDDLPEQAFYMVGGIDEVVAKASTLN